MKNTQQNELTGNILGSALKKKIMCLILCLETLQLVGVTEDCRYNPDLITFYSTELLKDKITIGAMK